MTRIDIVDDPAAAVANRLAAAAADGAHIALAGGSTPRRAYELAAERDVDWSAATVWFGDERCVRPDHPDSNFAMVDRALLSRLHYDRRPTVRRIATELGPNKAADAYEDLLQGVQLDLVLLGLGPDGHTASLFPHKPAVDETQRRAVAVPEPGMDPRVPRVTLTLPTINAAREVVFLVAGADKAQAVARAFKDPPDMTAPAAHVHNPTVLLDPPAAARL